jgi:hypothetical protein
MAKLTTNFQTMSVLFLGNHFACRSIWLLKAVKLEGSLWIASSLSSQYLQHLQYQKVLNQRNALLKYFALNRVFENDTLAIYNEQLDGYGKHIFDKERNSYLNLYLSLTTITTRSPDRKKRFK